MKKAVPLLLAAIMIAVVSVCLFLQDKDSVNSVVFTVSTDDGTAQDVSLYSDGDKYYAFLPSFTDFNTLRIRYDAASLFLDGKRYDPASSFADVVTDKEYSLVIKNRFGITVCQSRLVLMKGGNTPSLFVKLVDGTMKEVNEDKSLSRSGFLTVINADKTVDYSGSFNQIHGRGNSTWFQAKKPYALKFAEDVDLLGMGAGRNWVLLANPLDESGLRNKLAYDAAREIGVPYSVDSEHVDLYVDGDYYGLYLLTEKVEVGENRVNINNLSERTQSVNYKPLSSYDRQETVVDQKRIRSFRIPNNPEDITGGYLLQTDILSDQLPVEESLFQTDTLSFIVSQPKYGTKEQINYISSLFNQTEQELKQGDFSNVDLDSFAKYYLVEELFANVDSRSAFFYKDIDAADPKIHACSVWDLDLSMGNSWGCADTPPDVLYQSTCNWFPYLCQIQEFKTLLTDYYQRLIKANAASVIFDRLDVYGSRIERSFDMNKARWRKYETEDSAADLSQKRFETLDEHIEAIKAFMSERIRFLDSVWIDGAEYRCVFFSAFDGGKMFKKWYSIPFGEVLNSPPSLEDYLQSSAGYRFVGWFDENGSEFVPGRVITQNKSYTARLEKVVNQTAAETPARRSLPAKMLGLARSVLTNEASFTKIGLGLIGCAAVALIAVDAGKAAKSRRCRHDRKR